MTTFTITSSLSDLITASVKTGQTIDQLKTLSRKSIAVCLLSAFEAAKGDHNKVNSSYMSAIRDAKLTEKQAKKLNADILAALPDVKKVMQKPVFFYNATKGKKGSQSLFHTEPQTLKGLKNPKQKTATGKGSSAAPLVQAASKIEQIADFIPALSPMQAAQKAVADGSITVADCQKLLAMAQWIAAAVKAPASVAAEKAAKNAAQRAAQKMAKNAADSHVKKSA